MRFGNLVTGKGGLDGWKKKRALANHMGLPSLKRTANAPLKIGFLKPLG